MAGAEPELKLVRIRTFCGPTARMHARLAKSLLESEGIGCLLQGETAVDVLPLLDIPLLVLEHDAERAAGLLAGHLDSG